jgi:hypothetical protein
MAASSGFDCVPSDPPAGLPAGTVVTDATFHEDESFRGALRFDHLATAASLIVT